MPLGTHLDHYIAYLGSEYTRAEQGGKPQDTVQDTVQDPVEEKEIICTREQGEVDGPTPHVPVVRSGVLARERRTAARETLVQAVPVLARAQVLPIVPQRVLPRRCDHQAPGVGRVREAAARA